jgi:hypothetical protein
MAAFAGINSAVDVGIVKYVSAHKVKVQVLGEPNQDSSGVTLYVDYTRGGAATTVYTLTATIINTGVHATNEYQLDSSTSSTPATVKKDLAATGKWVWPIALPADGSAWLVITGTYTGTPDSTDIVLIEARRDTISGS